jgi:transcriptional regulator with XRE-family HTH domain
MTYTQTILSSSQGENWRRERIGRGLGLREAARRAQLSPGFLADIESGRRKPSAVVQGRIALAMVDDTPDLLRFAAADPEVLTMLRMVRDGSIRWGRNRVMEDVVHCLSRWRPR